MPEVDEYGIEKPEESCTSRVAEWSAGGAANDDLPWYERIGLGAVAGPATLGAYFFESMSPWDACQGGGLKPPLDLVPGYSEIEESTKRDAYVHQREAYERELARGADQQAYDDYNFQQDPNGQSPSTYTDPIVIENPDGQCVTTDQTQTCDQDSGRDGYTPAPYDGPYDDMYY